MTTRAPVVVIANTRMPSQRAQALQVAHASAAFARAGAPTTVLVARRRPSVELPADIDVFDWYGVPPGPRPTVRSVRCIDWIERVPKLLQYVPARLQEQTFARNAAAAVLRDHRGARILSREIETGVRLVRAKEPRVFLEVHRVPGGRLRRRWLLAAAAGVRGIVAISEGVRADLVGLGLDPALIIVEHDAFEPRRFSGLPDKETARTALDLPHAVPLVVYAGGLLPWKGADLLVEAARSLPDVYVAIAGGQAGDVKRLRLLAGGLSNVRIDGFQPPDRVALYLAAADVGVVPNRSKPDISALYTSPLKVFEAMAAGLPLVASDLPSLRELLQDGTDALLVKPDDAQALRAGIQRLLDDAPLRRSMSERLRARSAAHTWDARANRLLAWMDARE